MPATLDDLIRWRDALMEARAQGVRRVRDSNGEEVEYRSDSEMQRALAALDAEIRAMTSGTRPSTVRFHTSKGLD